MITKKIAVWMDHSHAQLLEFGQKAQDIKNIKSAYVQGSGIESHISNNESKENHIKQNHRHQYYKTLENELKNFDEILLIGSTTAKEEFYNHISSIQKFKTKKIYLRNSEKLTARQFAAYANKILQEKVAK